MLFNLHKTAIPDSGRATAICFSHNHRDHNRLYPDLGRKDEIGLRRRNFSRRSWSSTGKTPFIDRQWLLNHYDETYSHQTPQQYPSTRHQRTLSAIGIRRTLSGNVLRENFRSAAAKPQTPSNTPASHGTFSQTSIKTDNNRLHPSEVFNSVGASHLGMFEGSERKAPPAKINDASERRNVAKSRSNAEDSQTASAVGRIQESSTLGKKADNQSIAVCRHKRVLLNVGGSQHEVMWRTLARLPNSRLGRLCQVDSHASLMALCDDYNLAKNEFFFDRNATSFDAILNFYRTAALHLVEDMCVVAFKDDLDYWGINELYLHPCCQQRYYQRKEVVEDEIRKEELSLRWLQEEEDMHGNASLSKTRLKIWHIVEKPHYSTAARIFAVVSIAFIIVSTLSLTIGTLPQFQPNITETHRPRQPQFENNACVKCHDNAQGTDVPPAFNGDPDADTDVDTEAVENQYLKVVEIICVSWFTLEYMVRLWSCPRRCSFFKDTLNTIDLIAIFPFYLHLIIVEIASRNNVKYLGSVRKVVQMFRILRIVRIFKLARHSTGLLSLGYTFRRSYKELGLLMTFVTMGVILFSSLVYFAEKDDNPVMFPSIPSAFWWSAITMTTVGFGDVYPITVIGKIIGAACCICGVLVVALPIPIIVNNFAEYYKEQMRREKVMKRRDVLETARLTGSIVSLNFDDSKRSGVEEKRLDAVKASAMTRLSEGSPPCDSEAQYPPAACKFQLSSSLQSDEVFVDKLENDFWSQNQSYTRQSRDSPNLFTSTVYPKIVIEGAHTPDGRTSDTTTLPYSRSFTEAPYYITEEVQSTEALPPEENVNFPRCQSFNESPFSKNNTLRTSKVQNMNSKLRDIRKKHFRRLKRQDRCTVDQSMNQRRHSSPRAPPYSKPIPQETRSYSVSATPAVFINEALL